MSSSTPPSAAHRRVDWKALDRALAPYSTDSLIVLLHAALTSPDCQRLHDHLLLMFTRVLRTPRRPGPPAGAEYLPGLVKAVTDAAPGRGVLTGRHPSNLRAGVRHDLAGEALVVHPGQLTHPLLVLRSLQLTALATDEPLSAAAGFGIADVLELALRLTDRALTALTPAWPDPLTENTNEQIACHLIPVEVDVATMIATADPADLLSTCRHPERAGRALDWMTRPIKALPLRYHPNTPLLGPVLALTAHGRRLPVPAGAATDAIAPAAARLLDKLPPDELPAAEERLQEATVARLAQLFGLDHIPAHPDPVCRMSSPTYRYDIAVVSAITEGTLGPRVEEARAALADTPPGRSRLVVYGGPRFLGPELITDTAFLHVEEVAEILHHTQGDPSLLALFLLELTEHPGVRGVFYEDALDAWSEWHRNATLLLPRPDRNGVSVVSATDHDEVWERAAAHTSTDRLLSAAGLPSLRHFTRARPTPPDPGGAGTHTDLEHRTCDQTLLIRTATLPPLVIVAVPSRLPGAPLDASSLGSLADSLRTALTTLEAVTAHATLPDSAPLIVEVTVSDEPHQLPAGAPNGVDDADGAEWLLLHAGADPAAARIGIVIDPPLLAAFAGDGHQGHRIFGRLLHELITQVRTGRAAGPGTDADTFTTAWNSAHPLVRLTGITHDWPPTAPAYTLPRTAHLHARALRTAAAALRRGRVPAGSWRGADACRPGGPAEQLLHALEKTLADQISGHQTTLLGELARHLNAAWARRTRALTETAANLAAPWADNWTEEAGRRYKDVATATSALHLLLQQALVTAPTGDKPVDVLAVAELAALAELLLDTGISAVGAARRLHDLSLTVDPSGLFTLTTNPATPTGPAQATPGEHLGFDDSAYHRARQQRIINAATSAEPEPLDADAILTAARTPNSFTPAVLPAGSQLAHADRLLLQHWGCTLDALGAVLAIAADWPTDDSGIATVTTETLVAESTTWSGLPTDHLHAAVDHLSLHPGNAAGTGEHSYTEVERRTRPLTHPLIADGKQLLILPWLAHASREAYAAYLDEGRLPHPDLPAPVSQALSRHRQQLDQRLEQDVRDAARAAQLPHRYRLLEKTATEIGVPGLAGEIDLLVADPHRGRLWVIEAKNPTGAVASHAMQQHIKKFTARYRDKLLAKAATVAAHAAHAAAACGVDGEQPWRVLPLMVTRTIEPAAFLADPRVPYTTADRLTAVFTRPDDPEPGWVPPPQSPQ
ncbi:nuclease-related domain-containing protein [Streptomyces sp. NPDC056580]|uniref:nuclease-related domain-containing protein n=1 Tax=Streptomyces sp. NPDC056580 TaxID=3345872 RepID=UPI00369D6AF1